MTFETDKSDVQESDSLTAPIAWQPEDHDTFRLAQLLILLEVTADLHKSVLTVDRLGYYDFFSASPFVVVGRGSRRDSEDRLSLKLAGFVEGQLSYASTGQRWVSRRQRLQHDLALLLAYGLVAINQGAFDISPSGLELSSQLSSVYADAYRTSASIVVRRLSRLSDRALGETARDWLGVSWLTLDLLDDVTPESVEVVDNG